MNSEFTYPPSARAYRRPWKTRIQLARRTGSNCSTSPRSRSPDTDTEEPRSPTPGSRPNTPDGRHRRAHCREIGRAGAASGLGKRTESKSRHRTPGRLNQLYPGFGDCQAIQRRRASVQVEFDPIPVVTCVMPTSGARTPLSFTRPRTRSIRAAWSIGSKYPTRVLLAGGAPVRGRVFRHCSIRLSHSRCRPWPCDRLSRPRTTTAAPPRPRPIGGRCAQPTHPRRPRNGGQDPRRFPCSLRFTRRRRNPTVSQRHRHEYAAVLPHGLPDGIGIPAKEFPAPLFRGGRAPPPAQISQVRAGLSLRDVTTPVPRALLSITLTVTGPFG
ncbi:MAG: hypothetical protein JWP48_1501 [Actinoallomurus sp.]|nr:hypothetical protein [Actinoallomurus sp.]